MKTPRDAVWFTAAVAEAELGKKDSVESRSAELSLALKRQRIPSADTLPPDTCKTLVEVLLDHPLMIYVLCLAVTHLLLLALTACLFWFHSVD